ncbi:MAG: hypothetical protein JM58_09195 [Peptococcaceae bacterium BICA1-8]|nr:MAG: hypothetical protein JM58_09195 [Peptococcaceae bacterium BICA1-8]
MGDLRKRVEEALKIMPIQCLAEKLGTSHMSVIRLKKGLPVSVDAYSFIDFIELINKKDLEKRLTALEEQVPMQLSSTEEAINILTAAGMRIKAIFPDSEKRKKALIALEGHRCSRQSSLKQQE